MSQRAAAANSKYAVALTAAIGLAVTLVITSADFAPAYRNRALHVTKETVGALVLLLVAAVLMGRVRRRGSLSDLLALAGILVLAVKNLFFSVVTSILTEETGGLVTWRTTGAATVAAALLVAAAFAPRRIVQARRGALVGVVGGSLLAFVLLSVGSDLLGFPGALTDLPRTEVEADSLSDHAALTVADALAATLFLLAGAGFAGRAARDADELQLWLGVGTTIAGIAYVNYSLAPSSYTDVLYAGDFFRVAAVAAFGVGTLREIARYQAVYAPAAVLEDRRRVAHDLHEGVAQELALIASRMPKLQRQGPEEWVTLEIGEAVRRALDESRAAISTLNRPLDEPLHLALAGAARNVGNATGARVALDLDEHVAVPAVWEQALPRIVREAVASAVRSRGATTVTVCFRDADEIWLQVTDDGAPLGPEHEHDLGLVGIRERAESLGGRFRAGSDPGGLNSVEVVLP